MAMSEENVEILRRAYDAWNRGDLTGFIELFTPDATWHPLEDWPDSRICHGHEEIERLLKDAREPLERIEAAPEKLIETEDYLVVDSRWRGVIKGTPAEVELRMGMTLEFRGGKITEWNMFRTFEEALEAAGLSE
jgi:ketosteroid isomerase-like protein